MIMTQITLNIEDKSILPHLKKILNAIEGVSIVKTQKIQRKPGLEEAMDDVKAGRVNRYQTTDDLYNALGI